MATYADEKALVEDAARIFESIEEKSFKLLEVIPKLKVPIEAGVELKLSGRLKCERVKAEIDAIAGLVAEARRRTYVLHEECTAFAQEKNIDIPAMELSRGGR